MGKLPNILVTGTPGTGKTTFANMIAVIGQPLLLTTRKRRV